ncbi:MAG: ATP-binding protein [Clostridiales bacterium]|nr:ATP-binding protein [Clostridiales bacterium]
MYACGARKHFSDLNNPVIHSITDQQFDEWFGFTDEETIQLLQDFGQEEYYEVTREWYDGYRFGNQNVYCPWDVINWCNQLLTSSDRMPQNFWANSGGTDIIRDFANLADRLTRDQIGILIEGGSVRKKLAQELTYRDMTNNLENIWNILFTSGYLTVGQRCEDGSYELCIPNREVRNIFTEKVDDWFQEHIFDDEEGLKEFFAALDSGDAKGMEDCLNDMLMDSISYLDGGNLEDKENFYHGILLGMLKNRKGWDIKSNREAGKGRPDIVGYHLRSGNAFIIEVKYSKEEMNLLSDAKEALEQIDRQLYNRYFRVREVKNIKHYGIAFCKKYCRVLTVAAS